MKAIQGFENLYSVSRVGKVFSHRSNTFLKTSENAKYKTVTLCGNGYRKVEYIHRLVALAFIPNPDNLPEVNHKDGDRFNNEVSNLEWASYSGNLKHAYETKLRVPKNKHSDELCHEICKRIMAGWTYRDIAESLGIERHTVKSIVQRDNYNHVTDEYDLDNSPVNSRRLSTEKVLKICEELEKGTSGKEIARIFSITPSAVSSIRNRKVYADLSSNYSF